MLQRLLVMTAIWLAKSSFGRVLQFQRVGSNAKVSIYPPQPIVRSMRCLVPILEVQEAVLPPDLRGRTVVGTGYNSGDNYNGYTYEFGKKGGNNYVVLDKTEVPDHQHLTDWGENNSGNRYGSYGSANQKGSGDTDWDNYQFRSGFMVDRYYTRANASSTSGSTTSSTSRYDDARTYAGSTGAHDNKMPFLVMNYIIYTGVY